LRSREAKLEKTVIEIRKNVASMKSQKWTSAAERSSQRAREDYLIFE